MGDETKQVRVDNWGIFFLQRLQMFFSKTDYCDMTLQFEGNVQLKVHRLVMNACTEYFQYLEQHCTVEDNVILMPEDLQADVIVPIVNFMYTGVLEFHLGIFDKLYKTARVYEYYNFNEAVGCPEDPREDIQQRCFKEGCILQAVYLSNNSKRATSTPKHSSHHNAQPPPELPATLPGRKLPVWKRKNAPHQTVSSGGGAMGTSGLLFANNSSSGRSSSLSHNSDPLLVTTTADNTPKPTRFEWPDDDLPPMPLIETSFEDISYTSKPLLTKEEELRGSAAAAAFDDIRHTPNAGNRGTGKTKTSLSDVDMNDMTDYVKEQRIRVEMAEVAAETGLEHVLDGYNSASDLVPSGVLKRKAAGDAKNKNPQKKVRFDDSDNKSTTISVTTDASAGELDHNKIVAEILKKYPNLMKKNKNIKLKILTKNKSGATEHTRVENIQIRAPKPKGHQAMQGSDSVKSNFRSPPILKHHQQQQQQQGSVPPGTRVGATTESNTNKNASTTLGPWTCDLCTSENNAATPLEFNLYYLYRKHMTDVHDQKFDPQLCRYCGQRCPKNNLMMYHLHTKHGIRPPPEYVFPKCSQCPYIALSQNVLNRHQLRHNQHEIQCLDCKLAFTSKHTLTSHIQITGHHTGARRNPKDRFDCQYCTKKYTSGENLFSHVKMQHRNEAIRDGIVSIDEPDEVDEIIEQEQQELQEQQMVEDFVHEELEPQEEYILPEIISEPELPHHQQQRQQQQPPKKVNILSNVKVMQQPKQLQQQQHKQMLLKRQQQQQQQQDVQSAITLEPSSEAEALNNVATGIATSLGLVDIVVLNDNQQLFLQSDSHDHHRTLVGQLQGAGDDQHQPEFILPELSSTATVTTAAATTTTTVSSSDHEVITTSADGSFIARSMLTGEDIGSTDELVMVLTDHDYGDNQEEISADNSNIVVLYSHPVGDGQQEQFLTSQGGNIMVNSETGMIEIRNGTETTSTTATTAGETTEDDEEQQQIELNPPSEHQQPEDENDHPIESIEMIQKEIESHNNDGADIGDPVESKPNVAEIDGLAGKDSDAEVTHQQREEGDEEGMTAEGVTNEGYSLNSTADSEQLSGQIDDLVENMDVSNAAEETSTEADHQEREKPQDETTSDGTIAQESSEEQQHEQIAGDLPQLQVEQCSSEINTSSQSDAVTENGGEEVSISKGSEETSQDEILREEQDGNATLGLNDPDEELSGVPPEEHFADMTENAELSTEYDATAAPATDPLSEEPLPETDTEPRNETEQQTSQPDAKPSDDAAQVELPPTETNKGEATAAADNQEANTTIEETPDNNARDQDGQEETVEQPEAPTSLPPAQEGSVEKQQTESADPVDLDESSRLSYTMDVVEEEQDATAAAAAVATSSESDSIKTDQQRDTESQEQASATVGAGTRNDTSTCPMDVEEEQEEVDTGSQSSQEDDEEEENDEEEEEGSSSIAAGNGKRRTTCKRKNNKSNPEKEINHLTKKSILDDWDDTDSQQSSDQQQKEKGEATTTEADDAKATAAAAAPRETVNKLMDDWEEEEDEDEATRKDTD